MAAITPTRFTAATDLNAFESKGIRAYIQAFAATSALTLVSAFEQHVCYAQLTGAMTINVTLTNLVQFDRVCFHFTPDASPRVVTFGTGFVSSGTLTTVASKDSTVWAVYDGTNLKITSREIGV